MLAGTVLVGVLAYLRQRSENRREAATLDPAPGSPLLLGSPSLEGAE